MKIEQILSEEIYEVLEKSPNIWIKSLRRNLKIFSNKTNVKNRSNIEWPFISAHVLKERISQLKEDSKYPLNVNRLYWSDLAMSIRAIQFIFLNRSEALLRSSLKSLADNDFLSSAILCRSLIELCMWHSRHSGTFEKTINQLLNDKKKGNLNIKIKPLFSQELDDAIVKLIWGTNLKDAVKEVRQHKVLKIIPIIAEAQKNFGEFKLDLEEKYDFFSEFVHPNLHGNNVFLDWDLGAKKTPIIPMTWNISVIQNDEKDNKVLDNVSECISWSVAAILNSFERYENAVEGIGELFFKRPKLRLVRNKKSRQKNKNA